MSRRITVDFEESMRTGRIKSVETSEDDWSSLAVYLAMVVGFLGSSLAVFYIIFKTFLAMGYLSPGIIILLAVFLTLFLVISAGLYYEDLLVKTRGVQLDINKKLVADVLRSRYKTNLVMEGERMVTYYKRATLWRFGHRVIVLFEDDTVFLNIARFSLIDVKSVFHGFFCFIQARSILKEFEARLNAGHLSGD